MFLHIHTLIFIIHLVFVSVQTQDHRQFQLYSQIMRIDQQIAAISPSEIDHFLSQKYGFRKISQNYIDNRLNTSQSAKLLSSINIYDEHKSAYPAFIRYQNCFYSLQGKKIVQFPKQAQIFVSSSKGQFTYFAQKTENRIQIKKMIYVKRKPQFHTQMVIDRNIIQGQVIDFSAAFSMNKKMFAFTTNYSQVLFFKDGQIHSKQLFQSPHTHSSQIKIIRLNTHMLFYSKFSLYILKSSNPKSENIQQCVLPYLNNQGIISVKFDIQNFRVFHVMTSDKIYVYQYQSRCAPIQIYPLTFQENQLQQQQNFYPVSELLILSYNKFPGFYIYYNRTDKSFDKFRTPLSKCQTQQRQQIQILQKNDGNYIFCGFCDREFPKKAIKFSCFMLEIRSSSLSSDYSDFSKLRIPLILMSLFIIVYFGISRNNKKSYQEGLYQQFLTPQKQKQDQNYKNILSNHKVKK